MSQCCNCYCFCRTCGFHYRCCTHGAATDSSDAEASSCFADCSSSYYRLPRPEAHRSPDIAAAVGLRLRTAA